MSTGTKWMDVTGKTVPPAPAVWNHGTVAWNASSTGNVGVPWNTTKPATNWVQVS